MTVCVCPPMMHRMILAFAAGEAFQQAAAAATAFEDEAARSGWVPGVGCGARNAKGGRVHSYVKHALNRFLHAKRLRCSPPALLLATSVWPRIFDRSTPWVKIPF